MKKVIAIALGCSALAWASAARAEPWVYCAAEGQFCNAPQGYMIHYGAQGRFAEVPSPPGGLVCGNQNFPDPIFGVHKACYISQGFARPYGYGYGHGYRPRPQYYAPEY